MRFVASIIVASIALTACAEATPHGPGVEASSLTETVDTSQQPGIDDCTPSIVSGNPLATPDRRIEDIVELLTGERQTGDEDPVEDTIDDPNFGGVWGDFQGGVVVAVLDCSTVDADELARIAGGAGRLHLIEVPHTFRQVDAFGHGLAEELSNLGIAGAVDINSTVTGRFIEVRVPDPAKLQANFGNDIPADIFTVVTGEPDAEE